MEYDGTCLQVVVPELAERLSCSPRQVLCRNKPEVNLDILRHCRPLLRCRAANRASSMLPRHIPMGPLSCHFPTMMPSVVSLQFIRELRIALGKLCIRLQPQAPLFVPGAPLSLQAAERFWG